MMRSILAATVLGILAAAPAAYYLLSARQQDSTVTRPNANRAATEAAVAAEAWPICSSMASLAESADWAALDPDFAIGKRAIVAGEWTGAIKALTSAGLRDDRNADIQNYLGYAYRRLRMLDLAMLHYRQALILNPRHRSAHEHLGEAHLVGEPGIGKSRLATALAERIAGEPHTRLRYQCSPYHRSSALHPFIAQLERAAGFKADDTSELRLDKLEAILSMGASRIEAVAPLFAALLSIPLGERYPPLTLSPMRQRRRTLAALLDQFENLARRQPILLLFEDVHWADATSLELLDLTVERVRQLPVLALFTLRPEFEPSWIGLPNVGTLTLGRLDRSDVENMVTRVTGGHVPPPEVMKQIVEKTDGSAVRRGTHQGGAGSGHPHRGRWGLTISWAPAAACHSGNSSRLFNGAARPPGAGEGDRPSRCRDWTRVFLFPVARVGWAR